MSCARPREEVKCLRASCQFRATRRKRQAERLTRSLGTSRTQLHTYLR